MTAQIATLKGLDGVKSISPGIPSADGKALEVVASIDAKATGSVVIADMRSALSKAHVAGLSTWVTGPAALGADFGGGFANIDGVLLLVALIAVFVILLAVYRSLLLPVVVLFTAVLALTGSILLVYAVAKAGWVTVTGQSRGILAILAIGAATDYSLLLVARFREALHVHRRPWDAMKVAWRRVLEPIAASAATVILAVLCLLFSDLNSNRGLGPVAAIAILFAFLAAITALPALLILLGRAAFWPLVPRVDAAGGAAPITGLWRRVGRLVSGHPRRVWITTAVLLGACALGLLQLQAAGVPQTSLLLTKSESTAGQTELGKHYDAGSGAPVVVLAPHAAQSAVLSAVSGTSGLKDAAVYTGVPVGVPGAASAPAKVVGGRVLIEATLTHAADSDAAQATVSALRTHLKSVSASAQVGGQTALALDSNLTSEKDVRTIIPIVLAVILVILILLLRALVAPLLLIATVVLSYGATLGVSALVFNHLFRFAGADPSVPLFGFVFLVALGVDYNIFLMTRVREESLRLGTAQGVVAGLGATGGVITSAGVVLAATFAALGVIPILFLVQIAFIVAFGVLLDTVVVRSLLVPSLSLDIGRRIWWPSRLGRDAVPRE